MSDAVKIVEVGPRDGLQNEARPIETSEKLRLVELLIEAGVGHIEVASFVSPKWVPQMAGSAEVMQRVPKVQGVHYSALVPNMIGLEQALAAGCREIAVFAAASESFSQRNINCGIRESVERYRTVVESALQNGLRVRGYVSCVLGCPYEGPIAPDKVAEVAHMLREMGCYEISLGDTIGKGTPRGTRLMIEACAQRVPLGELAGHFHDTYGMAIANVSAALDWGVRVFDSSVAGLGGCPYAKGATGNVATEDVVYLLQCLGFETGINLERLGRAASYISGVLGRPTSSKVGQAMACAT
ncbi:MAG: hydroxymethylglutaryl-CoA lyase [Aquabacterium sp.]|jgi:hydroxymethylglutaryl-CoA lyase|uniref:hydroxymethylglutaryl-CoA lyase n=1 Tax=Aquabacterium sp. TaxID=1872578 RepID=UPI003BB170D1